MGVSWSNLNGKNEQGKKGKSSDSFQDILTPEEAANEFNIFRDKLHQQLKACTCNCSEQDFVKQLTDVLQYNRCKLKHCFSGIELLHRQLNELMVSRLEASVDKYNLPSEDYDNVGVYLSPKVNISSSTFVISPCESPETTDRSEPETGELTTTKNNKDKISNNNGVSGGGGDDDAKQRNTPIAERRNARRWKKDGDVELI